MIGKDQANTGLGTVVTNMGGFIYKMLKECHQNVRKYNFTQMVGDTRNTLPDNVITAPSVDRFKAQLDRQWKDEKLKYDFKENLCAVRITSR